MDKGRRELLESINTTLNALTLSGNVSIVGSGKAYTYEQYLEKMLNTKAVLEINLEDQTAATLRFIEALYAKRKVITNNKHLSSHPLYHDSNVFIFSEVKDFNSHFIEWLNAPLHPIDDKMEDFKTISIYSKILGEVLSIESLSTNE